ncbi:hypothetical protein FB451DRAFT_1188002 [Mycena latifolia]|nr:hypothetical protein FB451DRAFT_1188002 [Mycena latifolia]
MLKPCSKLFILVSLTALFSRSNALTLYGIGDIFPQCLDLCTTYDNMNTACNNKGNTSAIVVCDCTPTFFTALQNCLNCQDAVNGTEKGNLQSLLDSAVDTCNSPNWITVTTTRASQEVVPTIVAAPAHSNNSAIKSVGFSVLELVNLRPQFQPTFLNKFVGIQRPPNYLCVPNLFSSLSHWIFNR